MSTVAQDATSDLTAEAVLSLLSLKHSDARQAGIENLAQYCAGYQGQMGSRLRGHLASGRVAGFGSGTNPPNQGSGFGHTGNRPTGNR
jgi:hypothetical protein